MFMIVMMQPLRKVVPAESADKPDKPEDHGKARNFLSPVGVDKTHGLEILSRWWQIKSHDQRYQRYWNIHFHGYIWIIWLWSWFGCFFPIIFIMFCQKLMNYTSHFPSPFGCSICSWLSWCSLSGRLHLVNLGRSQTSLKMMERPGTSCHQLEKIKFTGMRWTSAACSSVSHCSLNCMIIWSTCRFMNVMNVMDVIFLTLWMFANVLLDDWDI